MIHEERFKPAMVIIENLLSEFAIVLPPLVGILHKIQTEDETKMKNRGGNTGSRD
jgi:hypothetical protein